MMFDRFRKRIVFAVFTIALIVGSVGFAYADDAVEPAEFGTLDDSYVGKTVILSTNDVHGAIDNYQYLAGLRDELQKRGADVYIVDSGDYLQGSISVSWDRGASGITMMNAVKYDVATIGDHEFDYSYERLKSNLANAQFEVICDNVFEKATGDRIVQYGTSTIKNGELCIGFFGVDTPKTKTESMPSNTKDLDFLDDVSQTSIYMRAAQDVKELKDKDADVIIGLTHLGVASSDVKYRSYDLWSNFEIEGKGFPDLLLDGHSHTVMTEGLKGEPIMSTGTKLVNVGVVVIDENTEKIDKWILYKVEDIQQSGWSNAEVKAVSDQIDEAVDREYGQKFSTADVELNGTRNKDDAKQQGKPFPNGNRDGETNFGDFASDALVKLVLKEEAAGTTFDVADDHIVAILNGGAFRAGIEKGDVTKKDIFTAFPFGNTIDGVYVKGSDLLSVLEASTPDLPDEDAGFPQVAGIDYSIDTRYKYSPLPDPYPDTEVYGPKEIRRVTINSVNGKPFAENDTYLVITNHFCATGGDTYYLLGQAENRINTGVIDADALISYITDELGSVIGKEYAEPAGRVKITTGSIEVSDVETAYTGSAPEIPEPVVTGITGKVLYKYYADKDGKTELSEAPVNAGQYYYKAYSEDFDAVESDIAGLTIDKAAGQITKITPAKKKIKAGKKFQLKVTKAEGAGEVTFKRIGGNKKIKVSKAGVVKVPKGLKKGKTYKVKVKATAAETENYLPATLKKTIKIKVRK